jgi:hypothetical protein
VPHAFVGEFQGFEEGARDAFLLEADVLGREQDFWDLKAFLIERDVLSVYTWIEDGLL